MRKLEGFAREVRKDIHKMRAFLRFREVEVDGQARFVAWFEEGGARGDEEARPYGLLEPSGDEYLVSFPMCGETRALAEAAGAIFHPDPKVPICTFADRASLEAALRQVATEGELERLRLVPAGEDHP